MSAKEQLELIDLLKKLTRPAWRPVVAAMGDSPDVTKFGGFPHIDKDHPYPCCRKCSRPLTHVVQLDLKQLPASAEELNEAGFAKKPFPDSYLQLFCCLNSEEDCFRQTYDDPECGALEIRLVPSSSLAEFAEPDFCLQAFPARTVIGFEKRQIDYPSFLEVEIVLEESDCDSRLDRDQYDMAIGLTGEQKEESHSYHFGADKLLGNPAWVRDIDEFECARCGADMKYLFQIGSSDNLPYEFGKGGRGFIFLCPQDFTPAFSWQ